MALKHVNAVVVGSGAGGGVVAKELSTAGLSVVLLERGKWYSAADCRKDDLHNQRTTVLGNAFGPDDERNPRVLVDKRGERIVFPSEGDYNNNAASVGGGTFSYGAQAWRYMEKDFRMRSTYGAVPGSTLDDWPISYSDLEPFYEKAEWEMGVSGDDTNNIFKAPRRKPLPMPPLAPSKEHANPTNGRRAPETAPVRHPHAAEYRAVQRPEVVHALPLVRGLCVRSQRANGNAQHRHTGRAGNRQLRTSRRVHDPRDSAGRPRPGHRRDLLRRPRPAPDADGGPGDRELRRGGIGAPAAEHQTQAVPERPGQPHTTGWDAICRDTRTPGRWACSPKKPTTIWVPALPSPSAITTTAIRDWPAAACWPMSSSGCPTTSRPWLPASLPGGGRPARTSCGTASSGPWW